MLEKFLADLARMRALPRGVLMVLVTITMCQPAWLQAAAGAGPADAVEMQVSRVGTITPASAGNATAATAVVVPAQGGKYLRNGCTASHADIWGVFSGDSWVAMQDFMPHCHT